MTNEINTGDCILAAYGYSDAYPFYVISTSDEFMVVGSPEWFNTSLRRIPKTRLVHNFGPGHRNFLRTFMYHISIFVSPYSRKSWKL